MKILFQYLLFNFFKSILKVILIFYCFGIILNLFEEIEFFKNLNTSTIKTPKLQETSTLKLLNCFIVNNSQQKICDDNTKKEIIPTLNRRIVLPLYIPVIALICSLLLLNTKKIYLNKFSIFTYSFLLLLFIEITVRYTGINNYVKFIFYLIPFILLVAIYFYLTLKFSKELKLR